MKGFVPVSKQGLATMLATCLAITNSEYRSSKEKTVNRIIEREVERTTVRRWYRLWTLPKARFLYNEKDVIEWSGEQCYEMFDCCPFKSIENDYKNTVDWINSLMLVAESNFAGEPIQLDINVFKRISDPTSYFWVTTSRFYYTVRA